jgi:hypothetical protein
MVSGAHISGYSIFLRLLINLKWPSWICCPLVNIN